MSNIKRFRVHNFDRVAPFNSERYGADRYGPDGFCDSFDVESEALSYGELLAGSHEQQIVIYDVETAGITDLGRRRNSIIGGAPQRLPSWYRRPS
jgi:hypothetical protein